MVDEEELETIIVRCIGSGGVLYQGHIKEQDEPLCYCSLECPYQIPQENKHNLCNVGDDVDGKLYKTGFY